MTYDELATHITSLVEALNSALVQAYDREDMAVFLSRISDTRPHQYGAIVAKRTHDTPGGIEKNILVQDGDGTATPLRVRYVMKLEHVEDDSK